jgi:hypothetical protein
MNSSFSSTEVSLRELFGGGAIFASVIKIINFLKAYITMYIKLTQY